MSKMKNTPIRIWTWNLQLRRLLLYPIELSGHSTSDGIRTHMRFNPRQILSLLRIPFRHTRMNTPTENWTPVSRLKILRPRPLDDKGVYHFSLGQWSASYVLSQNSYLGESIQMYDLMVSWPIGVRSRNLSLIRWLLCQLSYRPVYRCGEFHPIFPVWPQGVLYS